MTRFRKLLTSELAISIVLILAVSAVAYLPLVGKLGYNGDDWIITWGGFTYGPQKIVEIYSIDRPFLGWVHAADYWLLGNSPLNWNLFMFGVRLAGAFIVLWLLRMLWPQNRLATTVMALLYAVYPGFLQMPAANTYQTLVFGVDLGLLSLALMARGLLSRSHLARILLLGAAALFALGTVMMFEWMIGFDLIRVALLWYILGNRADVRRFWRRLGALALADLPNLLAIGGFLVWRLFLFNNTRKATDVGGLLQDYLSSPRHMVAQFGLETVKGFIEATLSAWMAPFYRLALRPPYDTMAVMFVFAALGILIFAVAVWWLRSSGRLAPEEPDAGGCRDAMVLGAVCALAALLPVTASNRGVELGNSYDRYTLTAMLGVCMFVSGFIFTAIASHGFRVGAVAVLVGLGIGTHFANASAAAELESVHRQFWWQLSWRAPDLQSGTVVVPLLRSTYRFVDDYDVFPPLNILYRPGVQAIEIPAQILNRDSAKKMVLSGSDERDLRTILFTRDYDNLLVISYGYDSGASTCLHAIDGRQLELSQNEDPLVPLVAPNSKVDRISVDGSPHRPPEVFFGAEPPHTWCYYYQKASLARQKGNWAEVARLGDEAAAQNFTPADRLEWMPFLEGYANLRRYDRVTEIAAAMKLKDRQMVASVCRRFAPGQAAPANYADADAYPFVVRTLCEQEP